MAAELEKLAQELRMRGFVKGGKLVSDFGRSLYEAELIPDNFAEIYSTTHLSPEVILFRQQNLTEGQVVRAWRNHLGMSMGELAFAAGRKPNFRSHISQYERGTIKHIGPDARADIARGLNISPFDIIQRRLPGDEVSEVQEQKTVFKFNPTQKRADS